MAHLYEERLSRARLSRSNLSRSTPVSFSKSSPPPKDWRALARFAAQFSSPEQNDGSRPAVAPPEFSAPSQPPAVSPPSGRQTELNMRLRLLAEKDPAAWKQSEMRAALKAGGVYVEPTTRDQLTLRTMTEALMIAVKKQWAELAQEEARLAAKRLVQTEAAIVKAGAAKKFRSRGAHYNNRAAAGDETSRSWCSDESSIADGTRGPPSSRSSVVSADSAPASHRSTTSAATAAFGMDSIDAQAQLRELLVPEWARNTLWSSTIDAISRCAWRPVVATPR